MAKWWCTELQGKVIDRGVQLHGGYGYMTEYPIGRAYADARITRIYGGTTEIMKEIIGRSLGVLTARAASEPSGGRDDTTGERSRQDCRVPVTAGRASRVLRRQAMAIRGGSSRVTPMVGGRRRAVNGRRRHERRARRAARHRRVRARGDCIVAGPGRAGGRRPRAARSRPSSRRSSHGDLVMAGNSNLLVGRRVWRADGQAVADVDGDTTRLCVGRHLRAGRVRRQLQLGDARRPGRGPCRRRPPVRRHDAGVRPSGRSGSASTVRPPASTTPSCRPATPGVPKLRESAGTRCRAGGADAPGGVGRHRATSRPTAPASYTVADIVFERAGAYTAVRGVGDRRRLRARPGRRRGGDDARAAGPVRAAGGLVVRRLRRQLPNGSVDVPVAGFAGPGRPAGVRQDVPPRRPRRSTAAADNLLFAGQPLGNNVSPGDARRPLGVVVGDRPGLQQHDRHPQRLDLRARHGGGDEDAGRRPPTSPRGDGQDADVRLGRRHRRRRGSRTGTSSPARRRRHAVAAQSAATPPVAIGDAGRVDRPAGCGSETTP